MKKVYELHPEICQIKQFYLLMIKNIIFDFGNVFIEWNPCNIFRKVYSEKDVEYIMQNVYCEEWNNNLDCGISFAENGRILSEKYPQHSKYIAYFHEHWYESLGEKKTGKFSFALRFAKSRIRHLWIK